MADYSSKYWKSVAVRQRLV